MARTQLSLDQAVDLARTGDVWLFRGRSGADRAIQTFTNAPVNHVGMAVVIDDLPPLMWHAELGRSLTDLWSGRKQRGVQLHDLRDAVVVWNRRYGQQAWLRQLDRPVTLEMEDAVLRTIARMDGLPFPTSARLAGRWARGRVPTDRIRRAVRRRSRDDDGARQAARTSGLDTVYCAEVVALTYQAMGLVPDGRRASWYDPGRFWSGDDLELADGWSLGGELAVLVPPDAVTSDPGRVR